MLIGEAMSKFKNSLKGNLIKKTKSFVPNLSVTPTHICFKNYDEGKFYKESIQILNQDLKTYHLAIKFDNTNEIKLSIVGSSKTKIDSGEDFKLEVEFRPMSSFKEESIDRRYEICLNIVNSTTKFIIPVLVLSPNPIINFPTEIFLPDTAVNTPAYSNIFVLNYSNQNQRFSFEFRNDIRIVPECKCIGLKACDGASYLIEYIPKVVGSFLDKIQVHFANGKKALIIIKCTVVPVNIFIDEENVTFSPTFVGMTDSRELHIVNNSEEASYFEWISFEQLQSKRKDRTDTNHFPTNYLQVTPMRGELKPNTLTLVKLIFKPEDTDDENDILKEVFFTFALKLSVEKNYSPLVNVRGKVVGPSFQLNVKQIDIGSIFIGESRFIDIDCTNNGVIRGKVIFQKSSSSFDGIIKISSKSESMAPGETKPFRIEYLGRKPGKFVEQAFFHVKNGERLSFIIQGCVKPLEISLDPSLMQFNLVPICVPQMQVLTLRNDLNFEIAVQIEVDNSGTGNPLQFLEFFQARKDLECGNCASIASSKLSVASSKSSGLKSLSTESCSSLLTRSSIKMFLQGSGKLEDLRHKLSEVQDGIATIYDRIDKYLEGTEIVSHIIQNVFEEDVKNEMDKRQIVGVIIDLLLENINESGTSNFESFQHKNWTISENPCEIEVSKQFLKLPPKSVNDVAVFLTANFIGKFTKNLKLKAIPSNSSLCSKQTIDETLIRVPIYYECQAVELLIQNCISIEGYAESEIRVDVLVENINSVDGFFTFHRFEDSEMIVKCGDEKFHIAAISKKIINLTVLPLKSGLILKCINLVAFGSNKKFPIRIECNSIPPDVVIKPNKISESELKVLVAQDTRIFIENRNSTKARFFLKLENENESFDVDPLGGILCSKQTVMINLSKYFTDPGEYRDTLNVTIVNGKTFKIPIKCTAKGLPIIIEPVLKSVDFGTLFVSKTPYFLEYSLLNRGKSIYMIFIILKNWKSKDNPRDNRYLVEPNRFELMPGEKRTVKFYINAENPACINEEFTIEGCSSNFPCREIICKSKLVATVIRPSVCFSQNELIFNCAFNCLHVGCTHSIKVMNKSNLPLTVAIKIDGGFYLVMPDLKLEQKVKIEMKKNEARDLLICFDNSLSKKSNVATLFEGKMNVYSFGKLQQSVRLQASVIYPTLEISTAEINIVSNMLPCAFCFTISNHGEIDSTFKLSFKEESTIITKIQERKQTSLLNISQCLMKQKCNLKQTFFLPDSHEQEIENILSENSEIKEVKSLADVMLDDPNKNLKDKSLLSKKKENRLKRSKNELNLDINEFLEANEVSSSDVQSYIFKHLTKGISEVTCNKRHTVERNILKSESPVAKADKSAENYFKLSQVKGCLKPKEVQMISIYFVGDQEPFHLSSLLVIDIVGGISHVIRINVTNCNPNLLITKTYFEMPQQHEWNEIVLKNICVSNISPAKNSIKLITEQPTDDTKKLINGFVQFSKKTDLSFDLDEQRNFCSNIKFSIFTGCSAMFKSEFGIIVNDKPPIPITFFSKNQLPMATLLNVSQHSLKTMDKNFEYDCLRRMFMHVKTIRVPNEVVDIDNILKIRNQLKLEREANEAKNIRKGDKKDKRMKSGKLTTVIPENELKDQGAGDSPQIAGEWQLCYDINGKAVNRKKPKTTYTAKMLHAIDDSLDEDGFQVLDYPVEYPDAVEITNFIEQHGFVQSLKSRSVFKKFKTIYDRHVLNTFRQLNLKKRIGHIGDLRDIPKNLVPLPLIVQQYEINLGTIELNACAEKVIQFYFHGTQLAASLRSETFIPEFTMKFLQCCNGVFRIIDHDLNCEMQRKTRHRTCVNRLQRKISRTKLVKSLPVVKRCHSFDFTSDQVHSRRIPTSAQERNTIKRNYSQLMKFKEKENPFVQSNIYQVSTSKDETKIFEFKITLSPSSKHYQPMEFDKLIYLDIHLGPQIPINVKASIVQSSARELDNNLKL